MGAPVVLRVYQLGSTAGFEKAEFFRLLNTDTATLGTDLVKKDEYLLAPGSTKTETLTIPDSVHALGVIAAFREFKDVTWRVTVPGAGPQDHAGRDHRGLRPGRRRGAIDPWGGRTKSSGAKGCSCSHSTCSSRSATWSGSSAAARRPSPHSATGSSQLEVDNDLLSLGKFAVRSARGLMPDGTPFSIPGDVDQPPPIDLPETLRNATIHIILATRQPGAIDTAPPDRLESAARFVVGEHEAIDTNAGYQSTAAVPIGRLRLRFALENDSRAGQVALGLIRVTEVSARTARSCWTTRISRP